MTEPIDEEVIDWARDSQIGDTFVDSTGVKWRRFEPPVETQQILGFGRLSIERVND